MTNYEFEAEYDKLSESNPLIYKNKTRKELIANCVKDLDVNWFKALVNRIVLNPMVRVDIDEAARGERIARAAIKRSQDESKAFENMTEKMSENGLQETLEKFNAKTVFEAVKNFKKNLNEGV